MWIIYPGRYGISASKARKKKDERDGRYLHNKKSSYGFFVFCSLFFFIFKRKISDYIVTSSAAVKAALGVALQTEVNTYLRIIAHGVYVIKNSDYFGDFFAAS